MFGGELADGLEHLEAGFVAVDLGATQETLLNQRRQSLKGIDSQLSRAADRLDRVQRPSAGEDGEPAQQPLLRRLQQLVAPVDRAAQRLLTGGQIPRTAAQEREPASEPSQDRLRTEDACPCGSELDRQWQAVQAGHDLGDRRHGFVGDREVRAHRHRPLDEQLHRLVARKRLEARQAGRIRDAQWWDGKLALALEVQDGAAGDEHVELRSRAEQLGDERRRTGHLLEVVEHQQHGLVTQVILERLQQRAVRRLADPQGGSDGRRHQALVGDGSQLDEEDAIGVLTQAFGGHLQRQSGLAGATRAGERDQAGRVDQLAHRGDLRVPAHEARQLQRQVVGMGVQGADRREVPLQAGDLELVDALWSSEVLEPMRSQVEHADALRQPRLHQRACRVRDEDLAAVACAGDARGTVHIQAHVVGAAQPPFSGVQAHAHADRGSLGPAVRRQPTLRAGARLYRAIRAGEGRKKHSAKTRCLDAAAVRDRVADDPAMVGKDGLVSVTKRLEEPGGALDVREQERDSASRECRMNLGRGLRHGPIPRVRRATAR